MTTLNITSEIDLEQVIQSIGTLKNHELENVLTRLSILLAQQKAPNLSVQETALLTTINQRIDSVKQQRYDTLNQQLHNHSLNQVEHEELLTLIEQFECANAERIQALIELAALRSISVDELMTQLGISAPTPYLSHA